ncbi:MAG: DNA polymerase III subunit delta [Clostridiales bacterium]|nr:DNA polymerase III subunit delta [Clostridiales bacterium]
MNITENEIKKQIRSGEFSNLYLIYGDEPYLKSFYVKKIQEKAVDKSFADFNLHVFEGKGLDIDVLSQTVDAYPMMSERTCVTVTDFPADTASKADYEKLSSVFNDVPETCILIFFMDTLDVQPKKSAKWRNFIKDIGAKGSVLELNKKTPMELERLVMSGAEKRGCHMSPSLAAYFISLVGNDMTNAVNELGKLCAYVGSGEIKKEDIDASAVKTVEAVVFDLTKALTANNASRAFAVLNTLFDQKTEPVVIMGVLISAYVDMYRAKVFRTSGERAEDAAGYFDYRGREFRLKNASRDASGMSLAKIKECLDALDKTDMLLKSSGFDAKTVTEQCIIKLLMAAGAK